jgi:hypothetical protein
MTRLVVLMLTASIILGGGILLAARAVHNRAEDGRLARERQIRVFPTACKLYLDAYHRGVITLGDLALVTQEAPAPCPAVDRVLEQTGGRP